MEVEVEVDDDVRGGRRDDDVRGGVGVTGKIDAMDRVANGECDDDDDCVGEGDFLGRLAADGEIWSR